MIIKKITATDSSTAVKSDRTLTVDGTEYDLDNLETIPEKLVVTAEVTDDDGNVTTEAVTEDDVTTRDEEIATFKSTYACYTDANGDDVCFLSVGKDREFIFKNNNYKLFFDVNLNDDLDDDELDAFFVHWNLSVSDAKAARAAIMADYTKADWKSRRENCGQKVYR
jgi:hypothetical protein